MEWSFAGSGNKSQNLNWSRADTELFDVVIWLVQNKMAFVVSCCIDDAHRAVKCQ